MIDRLIRFSRKVPKSPTAIFGYWGVTALVILVIFLGYYQIGKMLVSNAKNFSFLPRSIPGSQAGVQEETTEPIIEQLAPQEELPEGIIETWDGEGRVTVLIMGLDYRDWSSGSGPSRSDTMMLLTMDPLTNQAGILSIPRDLWVSIPGFDNDRINVAYFLGEAYQLPGGGPAMAIKTVEGLLGIRINYYAVIDFGAFVRFIDELGGVKIDVPASIRIDPIVGNPKILTPGVQTLPGELALAYARARNTPNGDLDRALRQQQVVFGIRERLLKPESLGELIAKAPALYAEISAGISTNMTLDEAIRLAWLAQKVSEDQIYARAISPSDVSYARTPDGRSVLLPKTEKIRQIRDDIFLSNVGTLGPLSPGTRYDQMIREGAEIRLINGTGDDELGKRVEQLLISQGINVREVVNGSLVNRSRLIDFTGNPHTSRYFIDLLGLTMGSYKLDFDPSSDISLELILGSEDRDVVELP